MFPVNQEQSAKNLFNLLFSRYQEGKCRSMPDFTLNRNMTMVCIYNIFSYGKSKSSPCSSSSSCFIGFIKTFKDERQVFFGNTRARILYPDLNSISSDVTFNLTEPPLGVCLIALSIKFVSTCSIRSGSNEIEVIPFSISAYN